MKLAINVDKIFVFSAPIDFRCSINSLCNHVVKNFDTNPWSGVFVFFNRNRDKIKLLGWHRNGFVMLYKILEHGKFCIGFNSNNKAVALELEQLQWLLAGLDWQQMSNWQGELEFKDFS